MKLVSKETFELYDSKLKEFIDNTLLDNLDLLSYGVSWKPNVGDPHLTRVGNMTYHKTLPIQNNMRGCIALMKDGAKIVYYLNPNDWRWHTEEDKSQNTLKDLTLIVTDGVYTLVNDVFKDLRFEKQWIKINDIACEVALIDTSTKTATLQPDSELEAGTYDVELGAVLNGYDGEVMVEVPEFWIKSWDTDTRREVRITPTYIDSTWEHQAHVLVAAYHDTVLNTVPENMGYLSTLESDSAISVVNTNTYCRGGNNDASYDTYLATDRFRSMLGKPRTNIDRATMREACRKSGKEMLSYLLYKRILYWLCIIEYASFHLLRNLNPELTSEGYKQGGLGIGVTTVNSLAWNYYNSINPIIPNGYTNEFGNSTNIKVVRLDMPTNSAGTSFISSTYEVPRWHGIENPFGDIWNNIDGVINVPCIKVGNESFTEVYATDDPTLYSDSDYKSMKKVGLAYIGYYYTKEWDLGSTAEITPRCANSRSDSSLYKCDAVINPTANNPKSLFFGGDACDWLKAGLGYFYSYYNVHRAYNDIGFRSSCIIK